MENILFIDRVRSKSKSFWEPNFFFHYYENEKISFKEKVYTLLYNMERKGYLTQGELDWAGRMMKLDYEKYDEHQQQFKKDYIEFEMNGGKENI